MSEHRGVEYQITKADNQWVWAIHARHQLVKNRSTDFTYSTRREADAACRKVIDRGSNATPAN